MLNISGTNDIALFLLYARGKIIAITGSNGKSTVTTWLEHVLQKNGKKAIAIGNIGKPVLDYLHPLSTLSTTTERHSETIDMDYWIMELSSFQLQITPNLKADLSTVINISADHIDRHHSLQQYIQAKQQLLAASNTCLINRDDSQSYLPPHGTSQSQQASVTWQQSASYGLSAPPRNQDYGLKKDTLMRGQTPLLSADKLPLIGKHHVLNALIVWMLAKQCHLTDTQIATTITTWQGLEHRFQVIDKTNDITWINDSKSTNIGSIKVAIQSCINLNSYARKNIILIVGGQSKKADFTPLIPLLKKAIKAILLFGEDAAKIYQQWQNHHLPIEQLPTLNEVVPACHHKAQKGDYVLFSPGCASFDQFNDYQHRGNTFCQLVEQAKFLANEEVKI